MSVYVKALIILIVYVLFSRLLFITLVFNKNLALALTLPPVFAGSASIAFLYFFTNEDLFKFARIIIQKKKKTEDKLIHKFIGFGRFLAVIIIGTIAGPLFCSLTAYLLISHYKYKYYLVTIISAVSIFVSMLLARGILHVFVRLIR